jgi:hypothetical protein
MAHSYQANPRWVFELMVRAFDSRQIPAIFLKSLDDLFAVHANCTDLVGISNTKSNTRELRDDQYCEISINCSLQKLSRI